MEYEEEKIGEVAEALIQKLIASKNSKNSSASALLLSGELGAGKTRLTKEILAQFGVGEPVISPTFVVMKKYSLKNAPWKTAIHIDTYRLKDENQEILNLPEIFADGDNLVIIEWPEYINDMPENNALKATVFHVSETKRKIVF